MIIETGRFGQLKVGNQEELSLPQGLLGFPECQKFVLVDPGDDTLILWLQSVDRPEVAFPVLEPKIIKPDYRVRLSGNDVRELSNPDLSRGLGVFAVLTIPENVTEMTANFKAPLLINLEKGVGKQVVLQEMEYGIRQLVFKELRTHLMTIQANSRGTTEPESVALLPLRQIPPNLAVEA